MTTKSKIPFEEVKLRLPKPLVDYVQKFHGAPEKWLEYYVVDWLRIDIENMTGEDLIDLFSLRSVFEMVLG